MQNNKGNHGRADRREDARRQSREQESVTSYRPRTRRSTETLDRGRSLEREFRPRRTEQGQESGSYRPRTAKRTFELRRRDEERSTTYREGSSEGGASRAHEKRKEHSTYSPRRERRGEDRKGAPRSNAGNNRRSEQDERRFDRGNNSRTESRGERLRNRDEERNDGGFRYSRKEKQRPTRERKERTPFSPSAGETRSRERREHVIPRREKRSYVRYSGGEWKKEQATVFPEERISEGTRERRKRTEERIGSAAPFAKRGGRPVVQRGEYFQGLDSELTGRDARSEMRTERKPKIRRNESFAVARENKRKGREESGVHTPLDLSQPMRLNRYIAHCGQCSRRDADEMITRGEITVNGAVVTTLGEKVVPSVDVVAHNGEVLKLEQKVYILLNKPKDTFCTVEDEHAERTVLDLVKDACVERIYPVGRLDRNTTGLLLLTNDGDLTEKLTHPSYAKRKTYEVTLDRKVTPQDMEQLCTGVTLDDGTFVQVDEIAYARPDDYCTVGVTIHTGQNRVVRRMFDTLGFRVERLDRVLYAGLTKRNLPRGTWRFLTEEEVRMLKNDTYR